MNTVARIAVARDSAVVAPRAPNTVPEAPAPKPAPASAPLPRWMSTSTTMNAALRMWMTIRIDSNIRSNLCGRRPDGEEFLGLQRRAAYESAVDVRHAEQLGGIAGLAAAAVQDAQTGRDTSIERRHPPANEGMDLLRLLWSRRTAGADGPDRLVGHHRAGQGRGARQRQHGVELARHDGLGLAGVTLRQLLAHAEHGREAARLGHRELARHQRIVLAVDHAPLGMAHEHVAATHIHQHRGSHLAGEGTGALGADILRAQRHGAAGQLAAHLGQVDERRAHQAFHRIIDGGRLQQRIDQRGVLGARTMHLPVACDQASASGIGDHARVRDGALWRGRGMITAPRTLCKRPGRRSGPDYARPSAAVFTASAIASALRAVVASSRPSTITRISGSVPEARSTTRPSPSRERSTLATAAATEGTAWGSKRWATRTLRITCGNFCMPAASCASDWPVRRITASTCSALTSASPVLVRSRHRMCPEVSPPITPPFSFSIAST